MNVTVGNRARHYRTVDFDVRHNTVRLIEQRLLPHRFKVVATPDYRATAAAIRDMVVRGAGAIGATAAFGLAQGVRAFRGANLDRFEVRVATVYATLKAARPTAVDPVNAMDQVRRRMTQGGTVAEQQDLALAAAQAFADTNVQECEAIGRHGLDLIPEGARVLTHCNAGWLAFVDVGSATAPLYAAQAAGRTFHVYCDETRPRCQGASLTAWELAQQGISHQVIADNAAGHLMQRARSIWSSWAATGSWPGPAKSPTRSAHTPRRSSPAGIDSPSTWRFRSRPSTGKWGPDALSRSRNALKRKSSGPGALRQETNGPGSAWPTRPAAPAIPRSTSPRPSSSLESSRRWASSGLGSSDGCVAGWKARRSADWRVPGTRRAGVAEVPGTTSALYLLLDG